jgi:hypothetical protein
MNNKDLLIGLTLQELEFFLVSPRSTGIVTDTLQRFILYTVMHEEVMEGQSKWNTKNLMAKSHQSFYQCNHAIDALMLGGWVIAKTDPDDKRCNIFFTTAKAQILIAAYESIKVNTLQKNGFKNLKSRRSETMDDLLMGTKEALEAIQQSILKES